MWREEDDYAGWRRVADAGNLIQVFGNQAKLTVDTAFVGWLLMSVRWFSSKENPYATLATFD